MRLAKEAKVPRENRRLARARTAELLARGSRELSPADSGLPDEECPLEFTPAVYRLTIPLANARRQQPLLVNTSG